MKMLSYLACLFILFGSSKAWSQETLLLRQPTLSKDKIVFVYANDLWISEIAGGDAMRLTSSEGVEMNPHFSHDGNWIAFTGQYDGNLDVYLVSKEGGSPTRLTYHPGADIVNGWTPDGQVLFRSGRESHPTQTNKFYTVSIEGGLPRALTIPRAAYGEISPDGKHIAYVPITSWDPEWRNYRGGQAMPIWIVDMKNYDLIRTPQLDGERHLDPVWLDNQVYYLSERDYASNIWRFDPKSQTEEQITFHDKYDVKSLDASDDQIVYEQGGRLHLLDPRTKKANTLKIQVRGDLNFSRPRWENVTASNVANPNLSPSGSRALFEHRGEIFSFPAKEGSWRNISNTPGSADRYPIWSPKGDQVAWFSDQSGEYQLVLADQHGNREKTYPLQNPTFYFTPDWSPDGKMISYTDTDYNIWVLNLESGENFKADTDRYAHPNRAMNPQWSPDSKWLTYAKQQESHFKAAYIYSIEDRKAYKVTEPLADIISPVWDEGGQYLYVLASTDYGLNSGWLDMSSYDPNISRSLYAVLLSDETASPTLPKSDEEEVKETEKDAVEDSKSEDKEGKTGEEEGGEEDDGGIDIDLEGIATRIIALPIGSGNYVGLLPAEKESVLILENDPGGQNLHLHHYDVKKDKKTELTTGAGSVVISADRKKMMLRKSGNWMINSTSSPLKGSDGKVNVSAKVKIDPRQEYRQIFKEGWRYMRDFLYVNNVHGAPWDQVYDWYEPWLKHVNHRTDLNYMVDILSGEVAVGHSYVSGGDMPDVDIVPVGLLGCDFERTDDGIKIVKIYDGESWNPNVTGPLSIPGIGVAEGDVIIKINNMSLGKNDNPYAYLEQTAGRSIYLTVKKPDGDEKEVLVTPVRSEFGLRMVDWIEGNRKKVDDLSGGKLAYVYVPNTGGNGFTSFNRYYFSQQDKKGAIIDERNNGGGSAADYMIDIMNRKLFGFFNSKANDNRPWTTPMAGIWGPKVMIINERAGSGGDLLPYMFRAAEIGPLVGTRTWGGLVGTWDTPRFIDGGRMVAPRGGFFDAEGNWAVEGEGIAPDIEVIQEPKLVISGRDPQLEAAVKKAMEMLKSEEFQLKPEPAPPVRWKRPKGFKIDK